MKPRRQIFASIAVIAALSSAKCGGGSGGDGSELPVLYDELKNGIIFATKAIRGSAGYDLYWIPFPNVTVLEVLPAVRLTDTLNDEKQPAVSQNGLGMAFAGSDGIYVITSPEGRVKQITDTGGTTFADSNPCVSPLADRVAWVREDTSKPIGETGFFETFVMAANFDGTDVRELGPKPGVVQDAPAFDPSTDPGRTRIAWSEFAPSSIVGGAGPTEYGVFVFDYRNTTGFYVCKSMNGVTPGTETLTQRDRPYRCFGQHLVWPTDDILVLGQDMLWLSISDQGLQSPWASLVETFQQQQLGIPQIGGRPDGFFPAFPISATYTSDGSKVIFDGVVSSIEGDVTSLSIGIANPDGSGVLKLTIENYGADLDTVGTHGFLFSLATPRPIPFF